MKKIFITFSLILIIIVLSSVSVFASEYDFILSKSNILSYGEYEIESFVVDYNCYYSLNFEKFVGYQPISFRNLVNACGCDSYESWIAYCESANAITPGALFSKWLEPEKYATTEEYFNKLYYYDEISQSDLDDLQAVIDIKSNEISYLESLNLTLSNNVDYLNNQVQNLNLSRGELLAVNASLEKQLQNKINLAYAQGLVDSGSTSNVIPILIGIITLLEGVALAFFIASKIKNRKKGR